MAMEVELDPRHAILPFKVRAVSKEAQPHKAAHILDPDPKNHWSTSTNAKEWLLLELEETCLLQQIRIHNKSVLEWEISFGLRYKPESFSKVRTRSEAPRRDSQILSNYAPCRFVRISCLRGNPIALYSVQLIGIFVPGLEPEFQPLVDHLLPYVTSNKQENSDLYLQLLREIVIRLSPFLTHLETDFLAYNENMEATLRFLTMSAGPFYPILLVIDRWERMKNLAAANDFDSTKGAQISLFTVSSNFQAPPRRSRSPVPSQQSGGQLIAFRRDFALLLLRAGYKDSTLGTICRMIARVFGRILSATTLVESNDVSSDASAGTFVPVGDDTVAIGEMASPSLRQTDYSSIFGDDFRVLEDNGADLVLSPLLDISSVEEGLLHFLYTSTSKPILCRRLAEVKPDLMPILPFIQAILPALRPTAISLLDHPEENFTPWQAPLVQRAFSQVVGLATTPSYGPLLDACAGYLMSFSIAHEKAACVIIDLCSGPLAPWLPIVVAKVDLIFELVEGILSSFQVAVEKGIAYARAALVYVILGLSGRMDEVLPLYKAVKHTIVFVIEILEPFLLPAITPIKNTIAFGDVSTVLTEKQELICSLALDILRASTRKAAALPALEMEWRKGTVKPSVLLHVLAPQLPMPPGIDDREGAPENRDENSLSQDSENPGDGCLSKGRSSSVTKVLVAEEEVMSDSWAPENPEDACCLFAPRELKLVNWNMFLSPSQDNHQEFGQFGVTGDSHQTVRNVRDNGALDSSSSTHPREALLHADFFQLVQFQERELRATEFMRLATELHLQEDGIGESRQAAIDCLLFAAECHLNPLTLQLMEPDQSFERAGINGPMAKENLTTMSRIVKENVVSYKPDSKDTGLSKLFNLEEERDNVVLQVLLKAAEWDMELRRQLYEDLNLGPESANAGISSVEENLMDATTIMRKHQNLICRFLVLQLQREGNLMYEALLQGLIFFLSAATGLSCSPELIVDIILMTARQFNVFLLSQYERFRGAKLDGRSALSESTLHRTWRLLCRLVAAASGRESLQDDDEVDFNGMSSLCQDLVPASAWVNKVAEFASSPFPLVRYIGWKGLARFGKSQQQTGLLLASDLQQLSLLLSVFADDLMSSGMQGAGESEHEVIERVSSRGLNPRHENPSDFLYPELESVCPNIGRHFHANAHAMLDAACLQLKGVPVTSLPDILSWFSELCQNPYVLEKNTDGCSKLKGFAAANIRFIILRLLEVILLEHMEAMVPELPRVFIVVLSLCRSPYCDIWLLDSVLKALKPIISYGLQPAASVELQLEEDDSGTLTMEALCLESLIETLRKGPEAVNGSSSTGALLVFLTGAVLSDLTTARRLEVLHLLSKWANFTSYSEATSCYNYVCAFQKVLEACQWLLVKMLDQQGLSLKNVVVGSKVLMEEDWTVVSKDKLSSQNVEVACGEEYDIQLVKGLTAYGNTITGPPEFPVIEEFGSSMESLVFTLGESLERAWKLHPDLAEKLTKTMAFCLMALNHLIQNWHGLSSMHDDTQDIPLDSEARRENHGTAIDGLCRAILTFQQLHSWQVAACTMDFLLSWTHIAGFLDILPSLSSVLQFQCNHAPRVSWRQHVLKWLSNIIDRVISEGTRFPIVALTELFRVLLEHREPEQRAGAIQQLVRIANMEEIGAGSHDVIGSSELDQPMSLASADKLATSDFVLGIVTATWDRVCSLAAHDPSNRIRRDGIKLLTKFVPVAQPYHLQSLLSSADTFLPGLAKDTYTLIDAPVTRLSLALLSRACLYSTMKEINTIPSRVWSSLEVLSRRRHGSVLAEAERATCVALLQAREQREEAKQVIQEALSRQTESRPQATVQFMACQESVLQVLARINAIRVMEDSTLMENAREAKELEEAEMELDLIKQERTGQGKTKQFKSQLDLLASETVKPISRKEQLEQLRAQILAEERSKLREEILARRERQKLSMHKRQLALEEWTLREMELLQELDREKAAEVEKDIERQRTLERERARTKELRQSLELEAEKRTQRDLQRELEQRESGTVRQSSRREFSGSAGGSRPRERYRERESGRTGQDTRSNVGVPRENSTTPPATPTAGSRTHGR